MESPRRGEKRRLRVLVPSLLTLLSLSNSTGENPLPLSEPRTALNASSELHATFMKL